MQSDTLEVDKNSLTIGNPFEFLRNFLPAWYIPIGFVFSLVFPIGVVCYYHREILKYTPFLYAVYLAIFGILISAFFIEEGSRKFHGNFTWQNMICAYLLFLTAVTFLMSKYSSTYKFSKKDLILIGVFIVLILAGFLYLFKMYFTGSYM